MTQYKKQLAFLRYDTLPDERVCLASYGSLVSFRNMTKVRSRAKFDNLTYLNSPIYIYGSMSDTRTRTFSHREKLTRESNLSVLLEARQKALVNLISN